jgi:hypothetical protein
MGRIVDIKAGNGTTASSRKQVQHFQLQELGVGRNAQGLASIE